MLNCPLNCCQECVKALPLAFGDFCEQMARVVAKVFIGSLNEDPQVFFYTTGPAGAITHSIQISHELSHSSSCLHKNVDIVEPGVHHICQRGLQTQMQHEYY